MSLLRQFKTSLFKNFTSTKKHKTLTSEQKQKMLLKTSKGKIVTYSLICILCFCVSVLVPFSAFGAFCALCACKIFS